MSDKANVRLIGGFVLGGIGIVVAALILLGSGKVFETRNTYYCVFDGSVWGLGVGAPVTFRGITIGEVKEVFALVLSEEMEFDIEVVFELTPQAVKDPRSNATAWEGLDYAEEMQRLIEKGLRATLETSSFVTGQRYVDLSFEPESELRLTGIDDRYPEIPTLPTGIDRMRLAVEEALVRLGTLPIEEILAELLATLDAVQEIVQSPKLAEGVESLTRATLAMERVAQTVDNRADGVTSRVEDTAEAAQAALDQMRETVVRLDATMTEGSILHAELVQTLGELSDAARAVALLAEYLQQHPEALLTGKGDGK